jgi:NADP-dependent 3-hydroxy acid dehydrogenase YdfG
MLIKDKVFVVTGAGGGIGGAVVISLLVRGAKVAAVDLRQDALDALRIKHPEYTDSLSLHATDITNQKDVLKLPEAVTKKHGAVDGLVNCAGVIQKFVKVNEIDYQDVERVMNINFYGTLHMVKAFLPYLLKRPEAYVANVSSMGGFLPVPGQSIYGASKAAVKTND